MATKKRGRKTKKEELEKLQAEVDEAVAEYVEEHKEPVEENYEFPPITLPARGYFRQWDYGESVKNLQLAMNCILLANIPVTGEYDADTAKAVVHFENKYGGCPNGKFGKTELDAYNKLRGTK